MKWDLINYKRDGNIFKNKGSNSLYSKIDPVFKYRFRCIYILGSEKRRLFRGLRAPCLYCRVSSTTSLNTVFGGRKLIQ